MITISSVTKSSDKIKDPAGFSPQRGDPPGLLLQQHPCLFYLDTGAVYIVVTARKPFSGPHRLRPRSPNGPEGKCPNRWW
mgnify:CR=1 FL=1